MTLSKLHKNLTEYKAIVLDMDGTLYYQFPVRVCMAITLFFHYLWRLHRISELIEIYRYRKRYELGKMQEPTSNIVYWMQKKPKKYIALFRDNRQISMVQNLQSRGMKVVVYSDYPLEEKLEALLPFVPDSYCSANDAEIQCLKPDTTGLLQIVNTLNLAIADIVFVGDRFEKDGLCAQQAGMDYLILSQSCLVRKAIYKKIKSNASFNI